MQEHSQLEAVQKSRPVKEVMLAAVPLIAVLLMLTNDICLFRRKGIENVVELFPQLAEPFEAVGVLLTVRGSSSAPSSEC